MNVCGAGRGTRTVVLGAAAFAAAVSVIAAPAAARASVDAPVPITGSLGSLAVTTGAASSGAHEPPPYIADAKWVGTTNPVLWVTPTDAGRSSWGPTDAAVAWSEVLALIPEADTPVMRQQFTCHWIFARVVQPDRPEWHLESWRPLVPDVVMIATMCNPDANGSAAS